MNPRTDKRPLLIAECATLTDVNRCLEFATRHELPISVRGGGHSFAGLCTNEGGLLLDVRRMQRVEVDPQSRTATVGGGALSLEVAAHAGFHGLAPVVAECPMVGVAGLALGGGLSALSGKHGATCDTVRGMEIVTATGHLLTVNADSNPDLFWALRGGGGNFGVLTSLTIDLFPLPTMASGDLYYRGSDARRMLVFFRDFMADAPDELQAAAAVFNQGGEITLQLRMFWSGEGDGESVFSGFRKTSRPKADSIRIGTLVDSYHLYGIGSGRAGHSAVNGAYISRLTDDAIDTVLEQILKAEPESPAFIGLDHYMHGKASRVPLGETAFDVRDPGGLYLWISRSWNDERFTADAFRWLDETWFELRKFSGNRAYTNYPTLTGSPEASDAYPASLSRLEKIKARYDPENVFHRNLNIMPA